MGYKLPGLVRRGSKFSIRIRVPDNIRHIVGKGEVWKSLETGDLNLAKEVYGRIYAEIQGEFSRARRSLMPQEPKPLTSEMARLFAVSWFSPIFEEEVENAFKSLGEGNTRELLQELDEDEAHLTSSADEEIQPSLQATADKILFQNGYPVLDQPEDKLSHRRKPKQPNVDRRSDGYWALVNLVRRGEIELVKRLRGVLTGQPASKIYDPTFSSSIKAINSKSSLNPSPISVSDLFEQYLTSKGDQSKRTILDLRAAMRPLLEMMGPKTTANELKHQDFQEVFFLLKRLPTNATKGKKRQGKSLSEIADQAEKDGENLLHPKTVNKYMARISAFMQWAEETGKIDKNWAKGQYLRASIKNVDNDKDAKDPFSMGQLQHILSERVFCQPDITEPAMYWVPLLSLFHGMRMEEILQLTSLDFLEKENIQYIRLHSDGENHLKNKGAHREIPIHQTMWRLGLRSLLFAAENHKGHRLFPDVKRGSEDKFSSIFSQRYSRYLVDIGAKTPKTSFHSYRHSFRDAARNNDVGDGLTCALGGWKHGVGVHSNYGSGFWMERKAEAISKIAYPDVDFSKITIVDWNK